MENHGEEIIELYPKKWILFLRKHFLKYFFLYIMATIAIILGINKGYNNYFMILILIIVFCLWTFVAIYAYFDRYRTPILVNENNISPSENKLKVSILGKRQRINFNEIEKINNIEKWYDFLKITILIKNGKKIELYVDELKDAELIKNTFLKFKEKN